MFSDLRGSIFLSIAVCSLVYNVITPSVKRRGRERHGPAPGRLPAVLVHGRHVVEGATISLHVLDHQVVLTAHKVFDADLLASCKLAVKDVLDPLASLCLRSEIRGRIGVHLATCVRSFDNLPAPPAILAVRALTGLDVQELAYVKSRRQRLVVLSCPQRHVILSCRLLSSYSLSSHLLRCKKSMSGHALLLLSP